MSVNNNSKKVKYSLYSLGLGFLVLGVSLTHSVAATSPTTSSTMSPAQRSMQKTNKSVNPSNQHSPAAVTGKNNTYRQQHNSAVHSLSPKNKTVFHALSTNDQGRVVNAHHKSGGSPKATQKELTDVLNDDHKQHQAQRTKQNYYD